MIGVCTFFPHKAYVLKCDLSAAMLTLDVPGSSGCIDISPDSALVAVGIGRNSVQVCSIETKQPIRTFDGNPEGANGWSFSHDGAWIAIASGGHPQGSGKSPGKVRVFEVKTGKLVADLD